MGQANGEPATRAADDTSSSTSTFGELARWIQTGGLHGSRHRKPCSRAGRLSYTDSGTCKPYCRTRRDYPTRRYASKAMLPDAGIWKPLPSERAQKTLPGWTCRCESALLLEHCRRSTAVGASAQVLRT